MKAYQISAFDSPAKLVDLPDPAPGPGEIAMEIHACGLNFADLLMMRGKYQERPEPPLTLGMEPAGVITALGTGVTGFEIGQRVMCFTTTGGLAEAGVFPAERCVPLPEGMPFEDAAAFQVAYGTSHLALDHKARMQPGENLLVTGAAGGVGLTAVESGTLMGANVIACARGADKLEICRQAGAAHLIDSDTQDLRDAVKALGGADVVYDAVGGDQFRAAMRAANPEARLLAVGFASGEVPQIPANHLLVKNITVMGYWWGGYLNFRPRVLTDSLRELLSWYNRGKLTPHIGATVPLAEAERAYDLLRARKSTGKVVVTM
ncbi:NADPH:quinone oxidoreductase family protein [Aliiroseovarius sp.]|uniref:NADPH:quinone oxidoreductase family protein n=1 Tax=Aliiroseovarius sp. TaxID=1872442 RepID=UPI0026255E9D|nr:NADPH:quinone oxidoreductase family protein [Aliiroseovarius sp.]